MNKNLPKLIKYIFPPSKERAGVWFLNDRDVHLPFISIGREIIDNIVLADKIIAKLIAQATENTYNGATSD